MGDAVPRGVSRRAVALGLLCCLGIAFGEPYAVMVLRSSPLAADFSTGAALFLFLLLTLLLNPLARLLTGSGLHRGELATAYIMMIVACAISSWGFTINLVPLMAGFFYYATPENNWAELIHPYVPEWLVVSDEQAVGKFFEGMAQGEVVPWSAWFMPLTAWCCIAFSVYCVTLCLLVVLRKQWMESERLLFPLATLPLEMCEGRGRAFVAPFFRNPVTWIGFLVPCTINAINALHAYYNFIPAIELHNSFRILRNSVNIFTTPRFEVIGLSFLLNLDVSLGVWFFAFLANLETGLLRLIGFSIGPMQPYSPPAPPSVAHIAMGALVFLVFSSFWNGRQHLRNVVRKALYNDPAIDDSNELISYRAAVCGILLGTICALFWLYQAGFNLLSAATFLLCCLVAFVGLARIVAQTGLAYGVAPVAAPVLTVNILGTHLLGPAGIAMLGLNFAWAADIRTFVMASAATGLKIAEATGLESRRLFWAILAAIAVTLAGSAWAVVTLAYVHGGVNLGGWGFHGLTNYTGSWIAHNIANPEPIHVWHLAFAAVGAVLMAALTWLKAHFVGFPIHPIGLALGLTWPISQIWFSVFIAWVCKALVLKYGGARLYRHVRPFFLGMVLGQFSSAGFWILVSSVTGVSHRFTL